MLASVIKIQPNHEDRIANGLNATVDQFPYMVSIRHASNLQHYCGGSILSSQWILTAGHCVEDPDPAKLIIYVGSISLKSGGFKYKVSNVILHENYSHVQTPFSLKQMSNDIALIKIDGKIQLPQPNIQSIELETNWVDKDVISTLSGWGMLKDGSMPDNLQYMYSETLTNELCEHYIEQLLYHIPLYKEQICTLIQHRKFARSTDSGGPLVVNGKQIGVVSWGPSDVSEEFVGADVFTRVSSYINWIQEKMKN